MMDLVYVLAIIGFFALCIAYTHAFNQCGPWRTSLLESCRWAFSSTCSLR